MKKLVFILALASLTLASCTQFKPETTSKDFKKPFAPFIVISEQTETSITFDINPADNTNWYAYTVLEGEADASVSASKILSVKTGGLAGASLDAAKEKSVTVTIDNLDRATTYTIYTVATSVNGVESELGTKEFTTEDSENPSVKDAATEEEVYMILFSEAVSIAEGLEPTAQYFAANTPSAPIGDAEVEVEVEGKIATFVITSELPAGAYYTISYPEGLFVDSTGNKIEAMESTFEGLDKSGEPKGDGIIGHISNENFDLEIYGGEPVEMVTDLMSPIWIAVPEDFVYYKYDNTLSGSIVYDYTSPAGAHSVTTYPFSGFPDYGWNGTYNCALTYPNVEFYTGRPDPTPGSYLTITIPKGFLIDIYGNVSNEFVIGPFLYAFDFTEDDVIGTYTVSGTSIWSSYSEEDFELVIEASDDPEKGNVMITAWYGFDEDIAIYCDFNGSTGTLVIPTDDEFVGVDVDADGGMAYAYYLSAIDGSNFVKSITVNMTQPGVLSSDDYFWGYVVEFYTYPDLEYQDYDYNFFYTEATKGASGAPKPRMLSRNADKSGKLVLERVRK